MDRRLAFLNGKLEKDMYVDQTLGFEIKGKQYKVYKLKKVVYAIKQAPRSWYSYFGSYFLKNGLRRSSSEPTLYPT